MKISNPNTFSPFEIDVLLAIVARKSVQEFAGERSVAVELIETHRREILRKLDYADESQIVRFAIRNGIATPQPGGTLAIVARPVFVKPKPPKMPLCSRDEGPWFNDLRPNKGPSPH